MTHIHRPSAGEGPGACAGEELPARVTQGDPDEDRGLGVQYLPNGTSQKATEGLDLRLDTGSRLSSMSTSQSHNSLSQHFTTSQMSLLVISSILFSKTYTSGCVEYHQVSFGLESDSERKLIKGKNYCSAWFPLSTAPRLWAHPRAPHVYRAGHPRPEQWTTDVCKAMGVGFLPFF